MTGEVRYREAAVADIEAIYDYIADDAGPARAYDFVERLRAHCDKLADFPNRGRSVDELVGGIRILVFARRATVAYRVIDSGVQIVRVFYAGRDYASEDFEA